MGERQAKAIIIGAGPAGLTAGLELIRQSNIKPIILEAGTEIGGLSRTVQYKGNRTDIGGHRFFSKSDRVMQWWLELFPLETGANGSGQLHYRGQTREIPAASTLRDPHLSDRVMLLRNRKSRIYFLNRFFDYPLRISASTLIRLGPIRTIRCGLSYLRSAIWPKRKERSLEDFLINRFGSELYRMFYKSYSEKVWGVPCSEISAEWGAQRIKGLSLKRVVTHSFKRFLGLLRRDRVAQKQVETSLIERFLYPKFGPGQMWERVADLIREGGGEIHTGMTVDRIHSKADQVVAVEAVDCAGRRTTWHGDYFLSTMPVQQLIRGMTSTVPKAVSEVSEGLKYRDFIVVALLARRLAATEKDGSSLKDNWIYIQDPIVKAGRLQIFNNWSPWLVSRPDRVWIGLEYFCNESDDIWRLPDADLAKLAASESAQIGIVHAGEVEDAHVIRVPKSYPAYVGSYSHFHRIREFIDGFSNLFLVGRNGMHKYNNQDHSMLTAMAAVENILAGVTTKDNIWAINTEMEYQEETRVMTSTARSSTKSAAREIAVAGTITK